LSAHAFTILDGGVEVGSIAPTSGWTKAATMRLPDTMPLQLQVFIVCVVEATHAGILCLVQTVGSGVPAGS
jgi:hypothetical protein